MRIEPFGENELRLAIQYKLESITTEQFRAAFEPFGIADDVLLNKGDGMSLVIAREIVSLHSG